MQSTIGSPRRLAQNEADMANLNVCVLTGSQRARGNTAELLKPFRDELERGGAAVSVLPLRKCRIRACKGCYRCQNVDFVYGCCLRDDMRQIVDAVLASELIVLATPIYTWYCTSKMKAALDRFYGLGKYYGKAKPVSLVEGKRVCILATHGYDVAYATDPFALGIARMCEHYRMRYDGIYSVRDEDDLASMQTEQAISGARAFARRLIERA